MDDERGRLEALADEARARLARLQRDRTEIVEAVRTQNVDDEHDPDGATLAWEREQLTALIAGQRRTLAELDEARQRLDAGTYGICEACGTPIPPERLAARPHASHCVPCASAGARGRR